MYFFFNDTATTEIYTLSLHDALPISGASGGTARPTRAAGGRAALPKGRGDGPAVDLVPDRPGDRLAQPGRGAGHRRSEEHTSELQSRQYLVCRLLLEKKKHISHPTQS